MRPGGMLADAIGSTLSENNCYKRRRHPVGPQFTLHWPQLSYNERQSPAVHEAITPRASGILQKKTVERKMDVQGIKDISPGAGAIGWGGRRETSQRSWKLSLP